MARFAGVWASGLTSPFLPHLIHLSAVADLDDNDEQHFVFDLVDDPVITSSHTPQGFHLTLNLLYAWGSGNFGKGVYLLCDAL